MKIKLLSIVVAFGLAVVAAGCGSSSDKKANEAYANSVCSAVGDWVNEVPRTRIVAIGAPGALDAAGLDTLFERCLVNAVGVA